MAQGLLRITLALALGLILVSAALPASGASSPTLPTTAIIEAGVKQAIIAGFNGVEVNYTSSLASNYTAFVYLDLVNSAEQTVYVGIGSCGFSPGQTVPCFVPFSPSLPTGAYTAQLFAVNTDNVPLSATTTLPVAA